MDGLNRRLPPQKDGNHSSLSIDMINSSDAMIDSATNLGVAVHPFTTDNDNRGPSDSPRIGSASTVQNPINGISSPDMPSDSTHQGEQATPDVQRDNQRPTQNRMAIDFILNSSPPSLDGSPEASAANNDPTGHVHQSGSTTSTVHQTSSCPCDPSGRILGNLNIILAHYRKQNEINEKWIRHIAALGPGKASADQSIESIIEQIDDFNEKDKKFLKKMKSEIDKANKRSTQIIRHQEQAAEAERKAKKRPLRFIADGTKSTVYELPETFGKDVIVFGTRADIYQERLNIHHVTHAYNTLGPSIWNDGRARWLQPFLLPNVKEVVPTGWVGEVFSGLVRPCENLDPRIPGFYDKDGNRMPVDSNDQIGLVLSRIGDLGDDDRRRILQRCYDLKDSELEYALYENEHFLIRIYLGWNSDDDELDDATDSVSDAIMEDAVDEAAITTVDNEPLKTLNLPGYFDLIIKACGRRARHALKAFAREIARAYALLHWGARLDGRGIEFLLGSSPTGVGKRLYMLDFNDCRPIREPTAQCVLDQLVPAALENDPYIPIATPGMIDEKELCKISGKLVFTHRSQQVYTWKVFMHYYLQASARIWEASGRYFDPCLPDLFIRELKMRFFEQTVERYADGVSDRDVASEDGIHDQTEGYYADSEQGESGSQEDLEYDDDEEDDQSQDDQSQDDQSQDDQSQDDQSQDDQSQDDGESFDNDQYGDDGYDSDAMDIDDSSEEEEDSDEDSDEDDDDDVD